MNSGFEVDAERVAAGAAEVEHLVARAAAIAGELEQALSGPVWGDDAIGRSFAEAHTARAEVALDRVRGVAGSLEGMGDRLAEAAARYREADETAAEQVESTDVNN
ncbi:hypothetical protein [Amycolatopsis suaedae]|uniref:PE domain-containing protein n=1 Tax=Amycolatopsis suaedae TaxID=2510978 RepID=A0A4Q7J586_9PSEU|nr:hypothetical protein [Amycolatopsis suaedae]RZQ62740.1 hypothetical protein EWH70_17450 [Amycolatopsis suaedae]